MYIAGDLIRGHTETIILARLMQRDSYGYEINKTVRELSGGRYELKEAIKAHLDELGVACTDFGTDSTASVDYPDFAAKGCKAVQDGNYEEGTFMSGQIAGMLKELHPCEEILKGMTAQAEDLLKNAYKRFE